MRKLILLRGLPASGKSTWLEENNLEHYTLSSDKIRLMYRAPRRDNTGTLRISQENDRKVWALLFQLLEERMKVGDFTIIDATHYKMSALTAYDKLSSRYGYDTIVVDFTNESLLTLLERNKNREEYKQVPEHVIQKMYNVLKDSTHTDPFPTKYSRVSREDGARLVESILNFK